MMQDHNRDDLAAIQTAMRIRLALNEASETLPAEVSARLRAARETALARRKREPRAVPVLALAGAGTGGLRAGAGLSRPGDLLGALLRKLGLVGTLAAMALVLLLIAQWQRQARVDELAEIDVSMLVDDLPPTAYADHGFGAYLATSADAPR